jgi:hypothetical protein
MKNTKISFEAVALLTFSLAEIVMLKKCADMHYDFRCKSMIQDPLSVTGYAFPETGLLLKMEACVKNVGEGYEHMLTWMEIDLLNKTVEQAFWMPEYREFGSALGREFYALLARMSVSIPQAITYQGEDQRLQSNVLTSIRKLHETSRNSVRDDGPREHGPR